jgi:carbohydrate diacid regulator
MTAPLSHELAQQIVDQVKGLLAKDISICNPDNVIVASSSSDKVGDLADLPSNLNPNEPTVIENGKSLTVVTPLSFQGEHMANLVIYDDPNWEEHVKLVKSLAELLGERYLELQEPPAESKDLIIHRLLNLEDETQLEETAAEAQRAGFDLERPRIALVVRLSNFWQTFFKNEEGADTREANIVRFRNKIEQALNSFFTSSPDNIVTYLGDDLFVVLKDVSGSPEDKFFSLLKKNHETIFSQIKSPTIEAVTIGIGSYHDGIVGLRNSFREASLALELGERMWGHNRLYHINNLGIPGIIAESSNEKKLDFADRLLGPLLPHKELVRTMEEFFKHNLNLTNTADSLKIHRNTLIYRLDKITSIVDLDPRFFQEAVQIYLALLIKRIISGS